MSDVLISSVQLGGSADIPNASVSFNFTKIKIEYQAQNEQGGRTVA
jgi:type VI protein secretion system component Hcp